MLSPDEGAPDPGWGGFGYVCRSCMHGKANAQAVKSPSQNKDVKARGSGHEN